MSPSPPVLRDVDEIGERVLDAARTVLCQDGAHRFTMEDIAREAKVARITVYRRFATKDVLIEQVVRREFGRYFDQFRADVARCASVEERVVVGFVSSLRTMRENELIRRLMTSEHDVFVQSVVGERGSTMETVRSFVATQLRREQAAGTICEGVDPDLVAEIMVRLSTSFLVTSSQVIDLDEESELRRVAECALLPLVAPRRV